MGGFSAFRQKLAMVVDYWLRAQRRTSIAEPLALVAAHYVAPRDYA